LIKELGVKKRPVTILGLVITAPKIRYFFYGNNLVLNVFYLFSNQQLTICRFVLISQL